MPIPHPHLRRDMTRLKPTRRQTRRRLAWRKALSAEASSRRSLQYNETKCNNGKTQKNGHFRPCFPREVLIYLNACKMRRRAIWGPAMASSPKKEAVFPPFGDVFWPFSPLSWQTLMNSFIVIHIYAFYFNFAGRRQWHAIIIAGGGMTRNFEKSPKNDKVRLAMHRNHIILELIMEKWIRQDFRFYWPWRKSVMACSCALMEH